MILTHQKLPYCLLRFLSGNRNSFKVVIDNDLYGLPDTPVIFAFNHSNSFDIPIAINVVNRHCVILLGKQRLSFSERLFFYLNGVVITDRLDKNDGTPAKEALSSLLKSGHSIIWFPEGTWNLTDNLLLLPLKWGIIEVAQKAKVPIVPVVLMYDREKMTCTAQFGLPIDCVDKDKCEAINFLKESMATLMWEMMCKQDTLIRSEAIIESLRKQTRLTIEEFPSIQWDYEEKCIYKPKGIYSSLEVFAFSERLIPCKENAFLFKQLSFSSTERL